MSQPIGKRQRFGGHNEVGESAALLASRVDGGGTIELVALSRIVFDPKQPRRLGLQRGKLRDIPADDLRLQSELSELEELSEQIKAHGVIQPVGVYRHGDNFVLSWGERRVLACELLGLQSVRAEILPGRPPDLRAKQLVENVGRKDLSLRDRLFGFEQFVADRQAEGKPIKTAVEMGAAVGMRKAAASQYFGLLSAPNDVRVAIEAGQLNHAGEAYRISNIADAIERAAALSAYTGGQSVVPPAEPIKAAAAKVAKKPGRPMTSVGFKVTNGDVVKLIVERLLGAEQFTKFRAVNWSDMRAASDVVKQVIKQIEKEMAAKK